ncbi:dienelactone hydrolase family protein [Alishewanella tabrizica]|uniref:Hydrolase n=1 Tax=Alishewanella tabrizica TaxID=671278 RepID=A0ABQ2WC75_9ALTE|nr:alpha/beta fold hydrolase [Alishewanella tabrizica]GGW49471.1 hydrolase [Alishewanella tabrizica]
MASEGMVPKPVVLTELVLPSFYHQLKAEQSFPAAWHNTPSQDPARWRVQARQRLRNALLWPEQDIDFAPQLIAAERRDGYQAERWLITITPNNRIPILLLRPEGDGPFPAVLLLHDHGAHFDIGKEKLIRPFILDEKIARAQAWTERYYGGHFVGDALARQGYLVLAADTLGWGDRGPLTYELQQALAANFLQLGRSLAGFAAYEDLRLAAFLKQLPASDDRKIAALGFSMGAFRAWQLAALTDDIQAAVAISWMTTADTAITPGNNQLRGQTAFWTVHPGLAAQLDYPHVAAIAAPKPMLFIMGDKDKLMPAAGTLQAFQQMRQVWQAHGAEQQLTTELWPEMGHEFGEAQQQRVWQWLSEVFN